LRPENVHLASAPRPPHPPARVQLPARRARHVGQDDKLRAPTRRT
jgi:hypothetical protein